jgi:hypothetical protein
MDILTAQGFTETYFQLLPVCKTQLEAFDEVNTTVYSITGVYAYKSLKAFKRVLYGV